MSDEQRNSNNLVITHRELAYGGVALALSLFFVFAGGYFWGKRRAFEELALQYDDECFAEKISQSLSLLSEQPEIEVDEPGTSPEDVDEEQVQEKNENDQEKLEKEQREKASRTMVYAQLCGFGTKQAAELYVERLKRRAIASRIVERKSLSKRGRAITWYQVVTGSMEQRELDDMLARIKHADRLNDVHIFEAHVDDDEATKLDEREH